MTYSKFNFYALGGLSGLYNTFRCITKLLFWIEWEMVRPSVCKVFIDVCIPTGEIHLSICTADYCKLCSQTKKLGAVFQWRHLFQVPLFSEGNYTYFGRFPLTSCCSSGTQDFLMIHRHKKKKKIWLWFKTLLYSIQKENKIHLHLHFNLGKCPKWHPLS